MQVKEVKEVIKLNSNELAKSYIEINELKVQISSDPLSKGISYFSTTVALIRSNQDRLIAIISKWIEKKDKAIKNKKLYDRYYSELINKALIDNKDVYSQKTKESRFAAAEIIYSKEKEISILLDVLVSSIKSFLQTSMLIYDGLRYGKRDIEFQWNVLTFQVNLGEVGLKKLEAVTKEKVFNIKDNITEGEVVFS